MFSPASSSRRSDVLLIAIHGYGGSCNETFQYTGGSETETKSSWLSAPSFFDDGVTTWCYEYNSTAQRTSVFAFRHHFNKMVCQQFSYSRERFYDDFSIVILAHSFGGIVAKSALAVASRECRELHKRVDSVVTFGTPHLGTSYGLFAAVHGLSSKKMMTRLVDEYRAACPRIVNHAMYERAQDIVSSASACYGNDTDCRESSALRHTQIVKYASRHDSDFAFLHEILRPHVFACWNALEAAQQKSMDEAFREKIEPFQARYVTNDEDMEELSLALAQTPQIVMLEGRKHSGKTTLVLDMLANVMPTNFPSVQTYYFRAHNATTIQSEFPCWGWGASLEDISRSDLRRMEDAFEFLLKLFRRAPTTKTNESGVEHLLVFDDMQKVFDSFSQNPESSTLVRRFLRELFVGRVSVLFVSTGPLTCTIFDDVFHRYKNINGETSIRDGYSCLRFDRFRRDVALSFLEKAGVDDQSRRQVIVEMTDGYVADMFAAAQNRVLVNGDEVSNNDAFGMFSFRVRRAHNSACVTGGTVVTWTEDCVCFFLLLKKIVRSPVTGDGYHLTPVGYNCVRALEILVNEHLAVPEVFSRQRFAAYSPLVLQYLQHFYEKDFAFELREYEREREREQREHEREQREHEREQYLEEIGFGDCLDSLKGFQRGAALPRFLAGILSLDDDELGKLIVFRADRRLFRHHAKKKLEELNPDYLICALEDSSLPER